LVQLLDRENKTQEDSSMRKLKTLSFAACAALAAGAVYADNHGVMEATADFIDKDSKSVGTATLTEGPNGVAIYLDLHGLPPGPKAIHIHTVGTCEDPEAGFVASKGHLNPDGKEHGLMNPKGPDAGDLTNLMVLDDGSVKVEMFTPRASLGGAEGRATMLDEDGAALVIHINRDDHITQPIGGAGPRIACGVVKAK
jgi:Cu-Zn family superoxide dismutase